MNNNGIFTTENDNKYSTPEEVLKALFGFDSFRTGQKEVIDCILSGRDAFAVMPTGAGKSICYQIPAVLLPGITLVISPLISLMHDQVETLNLSGISAAFINSSLSDRDFFDTVQKAKQGLFKVIYVAPERLNTDTFLTLSQEIPISMVTVDEAHCISQWGQDFRPSYMRIVEFVNRLNVRPIISAFTATATELVRDDVVCSLGLINPFVLVTGFNRENLFFQVEKPNNKDQYVIDYIRENPEDSGIVYCATRKNVDALYELLNSRGFSVAKYHAGMTASERKKMQDDFVYDYTSIIIATNAFGMGIDKSNVRFVIHYNMPQSMENYYQEAGRAGRDGYDAKCILLFSVQDIIINRYLLEHKEFSEMDEADKDTIRERDNQRLRVMERYCNTTECLRNFILKYFGEKPGEPCGDCGNCLREFETLDMTQEAKLLINCVFEAKGRYGKNIIIDTVSGAKTARLDEIGATGYKSYGVLASTNKNLLKRLMEQLIGDGYLVIGDYQVVKMGNITPLKNNDTRILVKITDDDKKTERKSRKRQDQNSTNLSSAAFKLLDELKHLRLEIAREENMPPYIIFSDKTLINLATAVPLTKDEMLNVSGVGESKLRKYGERFVSVIENYAKNYPEILNERAISVSNQRQKRRNKKVRKAEFYLLSTEAERFQYSEYMHVSEIRDEMNRICERPNVKKIPATRLVEILVAEGLIVEKEEDGIFKKVPTEAGSIRKIKLVEKTSEKGFEYTLVAYPPDIQRMLVEHYINDEHIVAEDFDFSDSPEIDDKVAGSYSPWTNAEDKLLVDEFKSGQYSVEELSKRHKRTTGAIWARLKKLNLIR